MLHAVLCLLIAVPTADPTWLGSLTCSKGTVVLERAGQRYQAHQGAGLLPGDRLRTKPGAVASFYLYGDQVVYLGGDSVAELQVTEHNGEPVLALLEGEARATAGRRQPLRMTTRWTDVRIENSILRAAADRYGARIGAEHGNVLVVANGREHMVRQGFDLRVMPEGGVFVPVKSSNAPWTIRLADYQPPGTAAQQPPGQKPAEQQPAGQQPQDPKRPRRPPQRRGEEREERPTPPDGQRPSDPQQQQQQQTVQQQPATQQANSNQTASSPSSLGLGSLASSSYAGNSSGGLFADANQQTLQGMLTMPFGNLAAGSPFPGNIHIVTGETRYAFGDVMLLPSEQMDIFIGGNPSYFSIGVGHSPTTQVTTDFGTGTNATPYTVRIPQTNSYLIRLDQFSAVDPALDPAAAEASNTGIAGLLGQNPTAPSIQGATPLADDRSANQINPRATFALGEFRLSPDGNSIELAIRSSDQDRTIVKDFNGNDAQDKVAPNADVGFVATVDPRFLPAAPTVQVPDRSATFRRHETTYSNLDLPRQAAVTTLMADQLQGYARRTGQTRFVITEADGRQRILDITGYRRQP